MNTMSSITTIKKITPSTISRREPFGLSPYLKDNNKTRSDLSLKLLRKRIIWDNVCVKGNHVDVDTDGDDDVIKWKRFPRYWPFVRGIRRSSPSVSTSTWFPLTQTLSQMIRFPTQRLVTRNFDVFVDAPEWINGWINNHAAGDLRRHRTHYDVIVMGLGNDFLLSYNKPLSQPVLIDIYDAFCYSQTTKDIPHSHFAFISVDWNLVIKYILFKSCYTKVDRLSYIHRITRNVWF